MASRSIAESSFAEIDPAPVPVSDIPQAVLQVAAYPHGPGQVTPGPEGDVPQLWPLFAICLDRHQAVNHFVKGPVSANADDDPDPGHNSLPGYLPGMPRPGGYHHLPVGEKLF